MTRQHGQSWIDRAGAHLVCIFVELNLEVIHGSRRMIGEENVEVKRITSIDLVQKEVTIDLKKKVLVHL